jgi:ribosomal protein S18 acetylase RimI-like enzyme
MLEIEVQDNSAVDKEELVRFYASRRRSETGRELDADQLSSCKKYVERVFDRSRPICITKNCLGYDAGELVGWLGINDDTPSTMLFLEYHPVIVSNAISEQIAQRLIQESIRYATERKMENIRVFVEVFKHESRFAEFERYYLRAGMKKTHTVLCMENKLSNSSLKGVAIGSDYRVESMKSQSEKSLVQCYNRIFAESLDNFTKSLDDKERVHWGSCRFRRDKLDDASMVMKRGSELVALIVAVDQGSYVELGPVGVVPDFRGRKLGKMLMETCLSSLIKQGKLECYLEVDETNIPATSLYEAYGFFEVSKKHGFLLRTSTNISLGTRKNRWTHSLHRGRHLVGWLDRALPQPAR